MQELMDITIILGASLMATVISRRIGIPVVVGQILTGIIFDAEYVGRYSWHPYFKIFG